MNIRKAKKAAGRGQRGTPLRPPRPARSDQPDPSAASAASAASERRTEQLTGELAARDEQIDLLRAALNEQESAVARLLRGFGGVLDSFDRLLEHDAEVDAEVDADAYRASVRRTHDVLLAVLRKNKVELIGEPGEIAEPETHNVLHPEPNAELPEDTVLAVVQRGIRYRERIVRPATVVVSSPKAGGDSTSSNSRSSSNSSSSSSNLSGNVSSNSTSNSTSNSAGDEEQQ